MSERLSDEQVTWAVASDVEDADGDLFRAAAREVQEWRAFMLGGPCAKCEGSGIQPTEHLTHAHDLRRCPNPDCVDGRVPGIIEQLVVVRSDYAGWAQYASDYFREKWDLAGDLARFDAILARLREVATWPDIAVFVKAETEP